MRSSERRCRIGRTGVLWREICHVGRHATQRDNRECGQTSDAAPAEGECAEGKDHQQREQRNRAHRAAYQIGPFHRDDGHDDLPLGERRVSEPFAPAGAERHIRNDQARTNEHAPVNQVVGAHPVLVDAIAHDQRRAAIDERRHQPLHDAQPAAPVVTQNDARDTRKRAPGPAMDGRWWTGHGIGRQALRHSTAACALPERGLIGYRPNSPAS